MNIKSKKIRFIACFLAFILIFMNCYVDNTTYAKNKNEDKKEEAKAVKHNKSNYKTDIIVKYKNNSEANSTIKNVKSRTKASKLNQKKYFNKQRFGVYEIGTSDNLNDVIEELNNDSNVEYAQPNYPLSITSMPTDDMLDKQWSIYNEGQEVNGYSGRATVDINVINVWNPNKGDRVPVIGVLDTGIDTVHKDLTNCIYTNANEIPGNGIDDDNNGYIDDIHGWDFSNDDSSIYDSATADAHGTYVAGIIAAEANNGGIVGVAPNVKVMPLKFIHGSTGYTSDAIEAIEYAMDMGIDIINCSFGGTDNNQALKDAMEDSGILFVCAAGNRGADTSGSPVYPAAFDIENVISVTSIDSKGLLPEFASFGHNVDIAAPGTSIISTKPENGYDYYSGTSVSSAIVSGIAALIQSQLPNIDMISIKNRLINTVTVSAALEGKIASEGRVDAYGALTNTIKEVDYYTGKSAVDDTLPVEGGGEADTWYIMNELANNVERFHYGEGGINPASGNYSVTCTDMDITAPGFVVKISRTYNSRNMKQTLLGRGWTFGFEGKITNKTDSIEISLPNGSSHVFNLQGEKYVGEGTRAKFENNKDGVDLLTTTDQYKYGFDLTSRKMIFMEDKNGNRINLIYSEGKLMQISDTVGRLYKLTYNSSNLLQTVTDPSGRKVTYTFNSNNLLTKVTDPEGGCLSYEYDTSGFLTKLIDQNGDLFQQITYKHDLGDAENKVIQTIDGAGETWSYNYDTLNHNTTITNNKGKKWTYWFDLYMNTVKVQDPEGKSTLTEFDYHDVDRYYGDIKAKVDRNGNRTRYEIDYATGNITKITNPDESESYKSYVYDQWNNVIEEVNEIGNRTFYIYSLDGARLLKKVQPLNGIDDYIEGNTEKYAITSYIYYTKSEATSLFNCNASGLLCMETDPEGNTKTYSYDAYGNIVSIKDTSGNITNYTYDTIGQKIMETTPEGFKTEWEYNDNGQVIRVKNPDGGVKRTTYDAAGHVLLDVDPNIYDKTKDNSTTNVYTGTTGTKYEWHVNGYLSAITDAEGNRTSYEYDEFGNILTETKPNKAVYRYVYDSLNRLTQTYFKENGASREVILSEMSYTTLDDGKTQTKTTVYSADNVKSTNVSVKDYAGREVMLQYGDYNRVITAYNPDGTVKQMTAANGASTYYNYDAIGNRINVWRPMSVVNGNMMYTWTGYSYDKTGNIISETTGKALVALNNTTDDRYTKYYSFVNNRMTQESDSEGRKTAYTYNGDGRIIKSEQFVTSSDVQITEYGYNYLGKQITVTKKVRSGDIYGTNFENDGYTDILYQYNYDLNGNLTRSKDAAGNTIIYTYDKLNRNLTTKKELKNSSGEFIRNVLTSKTYTWNSKVASETDANGNVITYTYDAMGNQVKITDALGNVMMKFYDRVGNNTAVVSPMNYIPGASLADMERTEFEYDTLGRVIKQIEVYQKMSLDNNFEWSKEWVRIVAKTYEYDALGNVIKTTDALGNVTESVYNRAGLIDAITDAETKERGLPYTVKYTYNGLGQKVKEAYNGSEYDYTYDGSGNLLQTKLNGVLKSYITYDLLGRPVNVQDARGNATLQSWNALGKMSRIDTPGDTTIGSNRIIYQYDLLGNLKASEDSLGKVTAYTYDSLGRTLVKSEGNKAGTQRITVSFTYDNNGNLLTQTDGKGNTTSFTYDSLNRKVKVTNALGQATEYTYDANNNLIITKDYLGNSMANLYDGINRLIEVRDAYGTIVQQLLYNAADAQISSYDALHNETRFLYDKNLRRNGTIDAKGYNTSQTYDSRGNIKTKTDGNGNISTFQYDADNRLVSVTDALGNSIFYSYDVAGNLLSQTDGNSQTTTYTYNSANLLITRTDPATDNRYVASESYTYRVDGLMATKMDRNGVTTTYTYDIYGRLIAEDAGGEVQSYTYDNNSNLIRMTDATGATLREYDALNRNTKKTVPELGISTYEYDLPSDEEGGRSECTTDPKGNITLKSYDRVGRLSEVTVEETTNGEEATTTDGETTHYIYEANGRRFKVIYPDGTTETYSYDRNNQVTGLVNAKAEGTVIASYSYTYDGAGNQLTKTEAKGTTSYTYDALNRLSSVTEPDEKVSSYTYDQAGNRKTEKVQHGLMVSSTIYNYDSRNRLLSTIFAGGAYTRYIYDNNGNMLSKTSGIIEPIKTDELTIGDLPDFGLIIRRGHETGTGSGYVTLYSYDHYNRLTKTESKDTEVSYRYNAQGYRVLKTVNGKTIKYLYESDKVVLETDGNNKQLAFQVYGSNLLYRKVAKSLNMEEQSYYYLYNAHGDVTALIDAEGNIAAAYDYDAFGTIISETGNADNYIKYAGYQHDGESGLYYLNARYYDSTIARFISEDSYRGQRNDPLSLNLYSYCANKPIKYDDPSGHVLRVIEEISDKAAGSNPGKVTPKPTPKLAAPTPKPAAPTPKPTAPTPKPTAPTPKPAAPTPKPAAPTPPVNSHKDSDKVDSKNVGVDEGTGNATQPSQETGNYRTVVLPDEVKGEVNGKPKVLYPNDNWGIAGGGDYPEGLQMTKDGRYKVAVAPKILDPNYPDDGKIWSDDFKDINKDIDVVLKNKSTGEILIINCYVIDIKAHSYNNYVDDKNDVSFNIESGLIQTGIAYPKSGNKLKFAPNNIDASVIEFTGHSTGDFDPDDYILVEIRVYK